MAAKKSAEQKSAGAPSTPPKKKAKKKSSFSGKYQSLPELPNISTTIPDVFIMESLRPEDEADDRFEGASLARLLRLSGKRPKYHYFEDERELPYLIHMFRQSQYRYLHFSSHGSPTEVLLQNDSLSYAAFAKHFKGHLRLRRAFFSCCSLGSELFSEVLAGQTKGLHSIVAPSEPISFANAAAMYQTLYLSLFSAEESGIKHAHIREKLLALKALFNTRMHFSSYKSAPDDKWTHEIV